MTGLRIAEARGYLDVRSMAAAVGLCDRLLRLTYGLTK